MMSTDEKLLRLVEELWDWTNHSLFLIKKSDGEAIITNLSDQTLAYQISGYFLVYGARRHLYTPKLGFYCFGEDKIPITPQVDSVLITSWVHNTRLLLEKYPELF